MRSFVKAAVLSLGLTLAACQTPPAVTSIEDYLASPEGQAMVGSLLNAAVPELDTLIAKGASSINPDDLKQAVYWAGWLQTGVTVIGPLVPGFTPERVAAVSQVISDLRNDASGPVPNTQAVVADAVELVHDLQPLLTAVQHTTPATK